MVFVIVQGFGQLLAIAPLYIETILLAIDTALSENGDDLRKIPT